jgi:hypothetical protein
MNIKKSKIDSYTGFYRGKVLENSDSSQLGRLKVEVYGVLDGLESQDLPWAVPAMPVLTGAGSGCGHFSVPAVGSYVWCFFEGADLYQPVYFAEAPDGVHGLPAERTTNYPNRRVLKTSSGITIILDDTSELVRVDHPSGSFISIDSNGDIIIEGSGNTTIKGTQVSINP